jgi:hypothetical protein
VKGSPWFGGKMPEQAEYQWRTIAASFTAQSGPRQYGKVRLQNGREIFRNYGRELKNGKGLSEVDLLMRSVCRTREHMQAEIMGAKDGTTGQVQAQR